MNNAVVSCHTVWETGIRRCNKAVCVSGIPGELFYVRRGIVNEYALSFRIPIKSDVTEIYFVWQSLHKSPPEPLVCSCNLAASSAIKNNDVVTRYELDSS